MPEPEPLVSLRQVTKDYRALRPLRVQQLDLCPGRSLALLGFDQAAAEVLVNLITGAHLPDTGEVTVFGQPTTAIVDAEAWVGTLDQFGLVSERAVLVERLSVEQNLVMPLSLELDDLSVELRASARRLADEVSLDGDLSAPTASLDALARLRLRLGRALALAPRVMLAEHPNATLSREEAPLFAADVARVVTARGIATLVLTADRTFASAVADEVLTLEPATGVLKKTSGWRRWF